MKKKYRLKVLATVVAYLYLVTGVALPQVHATASGHYTDLLPNPTSAPNIVSGALIYNGYDWSVVTLAPSTVIGDTLSRVSSVPFQVFVASAISNTTNISTFTALVGQTSVGSAVLPASWIQAGRSIRITAKGKYSTSGAPTWNWGVFLATQTIMTTGAQTAPGGQSNQWFSATALLTIASTGTAGTINGTYDIWAGTITIGVQSNIVAYSTVTASAITADLTTQLTINPTFTWGTASAGNTITFNNVFIELLN